MSDPEARRVLFHLSFVPMLVADDRRRYVDANRAACLMLRLSHDDVLKLSIDDLTPPEDLDAMRAAWKQFVSEGTQAGEFEMLMPDGQRLRLLYSATANLTPGRHISILDLEVGPPGNRSSSSQSGQAVLSAREREVLALVAMGETTEGVARRLQVSITTVDTHVRNFQAKLQARNRPHAIALALVRGEILLA